ncbi:hypothetical protein [Williamsia deligens]|uniref:DUF2029 domain-containing protein n=1 Tax=Williamsia deligens TaxID=321325 RepID=A0ABW3G9F5_9NOCA|nr:hypothetical protein [Williamsia deligens]MCP2193723.1 Mannosyltransferase (PIG-M) [Williamsia deligens]
MSAVPVADRRRLRRHALRGETAVLLLVLILFTLAFMTLGFLGKLDCGGPPYDAAGRSAHWPVGKHELLMPCYSDLQFLWIGRDINNHVFPFIHGGIRPDGVLFGGAVEYPVLSGVLMYIGAIGAHTDTQFFVHSAILLAPFGILVTVMLGLLTRWWALLWAATPPLILYAFHNWELPVVATAVGAVAIMAYGESISPTTGRPRIPLRVSASLASAVLAVGFCLKLYPGLFVVPLALYVATRGLRRVDPAAGRRALDMVGAAWVVGTAVVVVAVIELPFMILGYAGWKASLTFQGRRKSDVDTNSIWYWGLRHLTDGMTPTYNSIVGVASPLLILVSFVAVITLGVRMWRSGAVFPWVGVSAAMLAGFMLFHKVHSPQYTLWILPFFVLLQVRWQLIAVYLIGDLALDLTIFRLFGIYTSGEPMKWWVMTGVNIGVWSHMVVLAVLLVAFVRAPVRWARPGADDALPLRDYPTAVAVSAGRGRRDTTESGASSSTPPAGSS